MKKPKRSDFPTGRTGSSDYTTAMNKWRSSKKTNKTVNKDPRPKQSEIGKKYKNYGEFRQAVLAWKKRNDPPKKKKEYVSPYERKHGKKQKTSNNLKVKKESYAKDRVGKVDLNSKEYKEAKSVNERKVEYQTNQNNTSKEKGKKEKVTPKYKQVTQKELDKKLAEKKKPNEKLKVKPKKMHAIEKRNRERFGDAHVDKLKKQYADFKARRKKKKKS